MTEPYFAALLPELATRAARATVSRLGFSNAPLRAHLMDVFSRGFGQRGAFLGIPVFEATFGWEAASQTMAGLAGSLLHPEIIAAMDEPPGGKKSDYRFAKEANPYQHQIAAWQHLLAPQPQSVVVTSGTGSGKTECFMVPILNRLVAERQQRKAKLVGVRAILLYPLNALIQSQRERLNAWTSHFDDGVRFCLYNGLTPNKVKQEQRDQSPNEVVDREVLRAAPPPILVTNPTMLEFMLVRSQDAPILEASKGKLEWVVLDEAHTYIGSQAAELALLLRRVLHAFDVRAEDVRFVATSATIGGEPGNSSETLRDFIAKLTGVSLDRVHVVAGARSIPQLPEVGGDSTDLSLPQLEEIDEGRTEERYEALTRHKRARALRDLFVTSRGGANANTLDQIADIALGEDGRKSPQATLEALHWLDFLTSAKSSGDRSGRPFLPLRLHAFHNVLAGLWACSDGSCRCRKTTALDHVGWPYGLVYMEERRHCDCGAPVYELRSCNDCNATYLWARRVHNHSDGRYRLLPVAEDSIDEFTLDVEAGEDDESSETPTTISQPVLIANGCSSGTSEALVERATCLLDPPEDTNTIRLRLKDKTATEDGAQMVCPECGGRHPNDNRMFRRAVLGAPFLLGEVIPTLLEFCPDGEEPSSRPMRGRRMITFTDSRQGTARIAAKLQQDAERNRIRGALYVRAVDAARAADPAVIDEIDKQIAALSAVSENAAIKSVIDQKMAERAALLRPKPVSFGDVVQWLSSTVVDVRDWMHRFYSDLDPAQFSGASGKDRLAKILVMREFARRPKRLNSLETMGLVAVHYPKLDALTLRPAAAQAEGITAEEWRAFLKLALDFFVRENTFVELPDSWRKWGGNRIANKLLLNPQSIEKQTNRLKRWPQCNTAGRQSRLVRILTYVLHLDPETASGRDRIDGVLRAAWDDLVKVDLLRAGGNGRFLSLDDIAFAPITKAWVCPVTRRILDTTFRGVTPYLPPDSVTPAVAECRAVEMPMSYLSKQEFVSDAEKIKAIRRWADGSEAIRDLRAEGLWSDLSDRIIEGGAYFRAVEHSAQQPGSRLQEYERDFKQGYLNMLSCSTTMEMGVDIGGINMVAMNNVPPHPANYLQRAGRAGRRGETRSVALTLCKNNPHDQQVFSDTLWPFTTVLPAPSISLSSPVLVQRHVNAMLLADFLRSEASQVSLEKLDMGWWMLPIGSSRLDRFVARANCFEERNHSSLASGLVALLRHTIFEGQQSLARLAAVCAAAARAHGTNWAAEYDAIESQLRLFTLAAKEKDPAYKSLQIQKRRLTDEYLLRELASGGFLPGYGFPTNIISFDTLNKDELERVRIDQDRADGTNRRRVDNLFRRRELPSRDAVTAFREYAPGAEIVIDGLVYRSAGITLNWHAPASAQDVSEIQNIRDAWRCRSCGSSGTSVLAESVTHCPYCGAGLHGDSQSRFRYLEPAGFAVDLYEPTHNDVSVQTYVPVEAPWINASGEWIPLPNPLLGRFRANPLGTIFHHSAGAYGMGFAVCLECGRSEPVTAELSGGAPFEAGSSTPHVFRTPHRRLRGAQGGDSRVCAGSDKPFAIQSALRFGSESTTDVLEIVLIGLDGNALSDRKTAYTIAVALRGAVAASLGVEEGELGCDTKEIRLVGGARAQALLVFDRSASGYSSSVSSRLVEILRGARNALQCAHNCDAACQHCLLTFDTRFRSDDLDRNDGLSFLTERWLDELCLKERDAHFGVGRSFAEYQTLPEALTRELMQPGARELHIYLGGQHEAWDLSGSVVRKWIHRWSLEGKPIKILVPPIVVGTLTAEERFSLQVMQSYGDVEVLQGVAPATSTSAVVVATIVAAAQPNKSWAVLDPAASTPTAEWGGASSKPLIMGYSEAAQVGAHVQLSDATLSSGPGQSIRIDIEADLDGPANAFGKRFLERLLAALPDGKLPGRSPVQGINYQDRYLSSPLPATLLLEVISALKTKCIADDRWSVEKVNVVTAQVETHSGSYGSPSKVTHNWSSTEARNDALVAAFDYCGLDCNLVCMDRRDVEHARLMVIQMQDGSKVQVWLDQGFGYWTVPRIDGRWERAGVLNFPFFAEAKQQAQVIASPQIVVAGQRFPTHVFLSVD